MILIRTLIIGAILSLIVALLLGVLSNWGMALKVTSGVGVISWVLAGILSGSFISGDRMRANNSIESIEDKKSRNKFTSILFIFGLPFLIAALLIYTTTK